MRRSHLSQDRANGLQFGVGEISFCNLLMP